MDNNMNTDISESFTAAKELKQGHLLPTQNPKNSSCPTELHLAILVT